MSQPSRKEFETWFRNTYKQEPMPLTSPTHDFCWAGYRAGVLAERVECAERAKAYEYMSASFIALEEEIRARSKP